MMLVSLRRACVALFLALPFAFASQAQDPDPAQGQMVLHLLDYLSFEYPRSVKAGKVRNAAKYAEQVEFSVRVADAVGNFPARPEKDALVASAANVAELIADKGDGAKLVQRARDLQRRLIKAYGLQIAPARAPDLSNAAALYQLNCALCHGVAGDGNGPQAAALAPRPTDFRDHVRQFERGVFGLYNAISLGVERTSMPAFTNLSSDERWALAFYVSQFVSTDEERAHGGQLWGRPGMRALFPGLSDLVVATPAETLRVGVSAYQVLAYLRTYPAKIPSIEDVAAGSAQGKLSASAGLASAFIIIAREGLLAILVLAAVAALLIKSGRRERLKHLHAGWVAALLLGIATWIASATLAEISGAQWEVSQGLTALLCAAVLLYAGHWLLGQSHASRSRSFIGGRAGDALSQGTLFGIALVSFLAVYRQVFESVLLIQALWIQSDGASRGGLVTGFATAGAALAVLAWLVSRYSARMPSQLFFRLSSLFLAVPAVIFAGKGVAALQAAGQFPTDPLAIAGIPALGIYPSIQGLSLQALLVVAIIGSFLYHRADAK
ncbi:MAG: cytochrome c/FTR1 family iron permease [Betaproteobacteria bacterium]